MYLFQAGGFVSFCANLATASAANLLQLECRKQSARTHLSTRKKSRPVCGILIFVLILLLNVFQNIDKVSRFKEHMRREMQTALELKENLLHFPENDTTYLVRLVFTDLT